MVPGQDDCGNQRKPQGSASDDQKDLAHRRMDNANSLLAASG
jgi:hypothetical protein